MPHDCMHAELSTDLKSIIAKVREKKLTYLTERKLESIASTCLEIEQNQVPGDFIEAGCALGGSSIVIAHAKATGRKLFIYDVFGMIPPPTDMDTPDVHARYDVIKSGESNGIGGDRYYGYEENLQDLVTGNLESFGVDLDQRNVFLVKGLLQKTLDVRSPIAFAHIDVDWYEPVYTCLERIVPHLSVGGSVIIDDYYDWGGCRKAVDEYLEGLPNELAIDDAARSLRLTKVIR